MATKFIPKSTLNRVNSSMHILHLLISGLFATLFILEAGVLRDFAVVGLMLTLIVAAMAAYMHHAAWLNWDAHLELRKDEQSSHGQLEELFAMTDMLQAADTYDDAGAVLMATSKRILPDYGGALYIFNNSRDRLDLAKSWCDHGSFEPPSSLTPQSCWAMKRGKPHINDPHAQTLCCDHSGFGGSMATVEIPMIARGAVHGLLILALNEAASFNRLKNVRRLGRALADSMSLALSNITLRESLRTQSLRDPLTGLYNRRYMEDTLQRAIGLGSREGVATSVIMIDLDNFKKLNDVHGHAKGDAVLRDVASQLIGAVRPTDVVCRYGGEELLIVMPACPLDQAALKAEAMRSAIAMLSDSHGCDISASFGVASIPETSMASSDLVTAADTALYEAKANGKNCVRLAPPRAASLTKRKPRLASIAKN